MQIIKDLNNVVLFAGEGFVLTDKDLKAPGFRAISVNSITHTLSEVDSVPSDWSGGHYTEINGVWALTEFGQSEKEKKDVKAFEDTYFNMESAVDKHIDTVAQAKGYDSRITAALRAGYENPWQVEGIAFGTWMDACYTYCYQVQQEVIAGTRPVPTIQELISELPTMIWPEV